MDDELLDLVNRNDAVIGTINRMDYDTLMKDELGYIRAVDLFIVNDNNQIFVPTRTADKTIAPNGYDYSVGGHVGAGEDYLETLLREAEEELYLTISTENVEFITKTISDEIHYIRCVYVLRSNETPRLNPRDFVGAEWMTIAELLEKIEAGHPAKMNLSETATVVLKHLESHSKSSAQ